MEFSGINTIFKLKQKGKFILYTLGIWISIILLLICMFCLPETSGFTFDDFFIIVVGTFGMIPASGGIGAFNLAMKYGFMALFISMGKSGELGGEMGLPILLFLCLCRFVCWSWDYFYSDAGKSKK
jgi:hypothetical protein